MARGRLMRRGGVCFIGLLVIGWTASVPQAQAIKARSSVEATKHPEVVLISGRKARPRQAGRATGVLIAPNAVLTAAHAVARFDTWDVTAPYARKRPAKVAVKAIRIHPKFREDPIENDLAVLILTRPIEIPGKYPTLHGGALYPIETPLVVVGRVDNGTLSNDRLFRAKLTLVEFRGNINVYGGHPHTVEEGDSGGPVYFAGKEHELAAIVSGNTSFSRGTVPTDVFTPISQRNRDWILRQVPRGDR